MRYSFRFRCRHATSSVSHVAAKTVDAAQLEGACAVLLVQHPVQATGPCGAATSTRATELTYRFGNFGGRPRLICQTRSTVTSPEASSTS